MNLEQIQTALREQQVDGWLFYDHHHRDPIAYRILGLSEDLFVYAALVLLHPGRGHAAQIDPPDRERKARLSTRQRERLLLLAGTRSRLEHHA